MSENKYEFIKKWLAPCGLHCGKCFAFTEEGICNQSNRLKEALGSFDIYAEHYPYLS